MGTERERVKILEQAERSVKRGKLQEAINEYLKLLDFDAQDVNVRNLLSDLYLRANQRDRAIEEMYKVASYYEGRGMYSQSMAVYKKINKLNPGNIESSMKLADLYYTQGFLSEAKAEYSKIARGLMKNHRTKEAIFLYEKLLKLDRKDVQTCLTLADLYTRGGEVDKAVDRLNDVAEFRIRDNSLKEAHEILKRAQKIKAEDSRTFSNLVSILKKEKKTKEARKLIDEVLQKKKEDVTALRLLGNLHFDEGDFERAEVVFSQVIALRSKDVEARVKLGRISIFKDNLDKAFKFYEPLVESLIKKGKPEKAIGLLGLILASKKAHLPTLKSLASIYKTIDQRKNLEIVYRVLLDEYRRDNNKKEYASILGELVEINPEDKELANQYTLLKGDGAIPEVAREPEVEKAALEEEARKAAEEDAKKAEEERLRAEEQVRQLGEEKRRAEEERLKAEDDAKKAEEERLRAEEEAKRVEEERSKAEGEARKAVEEEALRAAEKEARKRVEEEARKAEEAAQRAEQAARKAAEEEARRAVEEEARSRAEELAERAEAEKKRAEEERLRAEEAVRKAEEERRRAEEERFKAEQEAKRLEEEKRRAEEERRKAEEGAPRAEEERMRIEEETRRMADEEARKVAEEEARRAAEDEAKRAADEERKRMEALEAAHVSTEEIRELEEIIEEEKEEEPAAAPEGSDEMLEMNLAQADLYINQGLLRNAKRILENLRINFPNNPRIEEKLSALGQVSTQVSVDEILQRVTEVSEKESELIGKRGVAKEIPEQPKEATKETAAPAEKASIPEEKERKVEKKEIPLKKLEDKEEEVKKTAEKEVAAKEDKMDLFHSGFSFLEKGEFDQAIEIFKQASKDESLREECFHALGQCYKQKDEYLEAAKWLKKAQELTVEGSDQFLALSYELASLYEEAKELEKALDLYEDIKEWDAKYRDIRKKTKALKKSIK